MFHPDLCHDQAELNSFVFMFLLISHLRLLYREIACWDCCPFPLSLLSNPPTRMCSDLLSNFQDFIGFCLFGAVGFKASFWVLLSNNFCNLFSLFDESN